MSDRAALYAAVCANPDDDTVRLAFADWFDENGNPKRAELIRAQIALAAAYHADTPAAEMFRHLELEDLVADEVDWSELSAELHAAVEAKKAEDRTAAPVSPKTEGTPRLNGVRFEVSWRGFLSRVELSGRAFIDHAAAIFRAAPITQVDLNQVDADEAKAIVKTGCLGRARRLVLSYGIEPAAVEIFGRHPDAAGVRSLEIDGIDGPDDYFESMARGPHWTGLESLELVDFDTGSRPAVTDAAAATMFRRKPFRGLKTIRAWGCGLRGETARAFATGSFPNLRFLDLSLNNLDTAAGEALAAAKGMPGLRKLDLSSNRIRSGDALAALIASPHFPELLVLRLEDNGARGLKPSSWPKKSRGLGLRFLYLEGNTLTAAGAESLFAHPSVAGLWALDVSGCNLPDRGLRALAKAGLPQLTVLHMANNPFPGGAVAELVNSPVAESLQWLDVAQVKLGAAGLKALIESERLGKLKKLHASGQGRAKLRKRFGKKLAD